MFIKKIKNNNTGFTLIETLIYIALFTLLLGSAFMTAFQLIEGNDVLSEKTVIQEETNFIMRKINWALSGVESIQSPSSFLPYSDTLRVIKYNGDIIDICLDAEKIKIKEGGGVVTCSDSDFLPLTTDNVKVGSLQFRYLSPVGGSPSGVVASTTISGFVSTTTRYIRK